MTDINHQEPANFEGALDDGELTLEELERIAGGQSGGTDPQLAIFQGDVQTLPTPPLVMDPAKTDSSYTSYFGATGSTSTISSHMLSLPLNMTNLFP